MITRRSLLQHGACAAGFNLMAGSALAAPSAKMHGFRYPEEAGPHERTFMQWPVSRKVYDDAVFLEMLQKTIAVIANSISGFEPVVMLMDKSHQMQARKLLGAAVEIWDIATDDLWARDSGPSFVINTSGAIALTQFNFNGWGNKQVHGNDGKIAAKIAERLGLQIFDNGLVGEAGGVESDGAGTLIAHESSWVNPNRNKGGREQVEKLLLEAMGGERMIWAPGIKGADITDDHIDALARFVKPGMVVLQLPDEVDPNDPWSRSAFETYDILVANTDYSKRAMELVLLPEPVNIRVKSDDFVASYVNYYVCNGAVIASNFGDKNADAEAAATLAKLYPDREIVVLNTDPVGEVGGGIHCATHQQPRV